MRVRFGSFWVYLRERDEQDAEKRITEKQVGEERQIYFLWNLKYVKLLLLFNKITFLTFWLMYVTTTLILH